MALFRESKYYIASNGFNLVRTELSCKQAHTQQQPVPLTAGTFFSECIPLEEGVYVRGRGGRKEEGTVFPQYYVQCVI